MDFRCQGRDSTAQSASGTSTSRILPGLMVGKSPCIDDDLGLSAWIEGAERFENPVRAGRVVRAGHDGSSAVRRYRGRNLGRVGCDRDPADSGGFRPAQHVDDHRQAGHLQ